MGRRRKSELREVVEVLAALPSWALVIAAVLSYVILHALARPPVVPSGADAAKQLGPVMVHAVIAGAAVFGQYLVPILCLIAAAMSMFKRRQGRDLASRVATAPSAAALVLRVTEPHATTLGSVASADHGSEAGVPAFPVCGSGMVLRKARKGANAGKAFWGCERYPGCRGTRPA